MWSSTYGYFAAYKHISLWIWWPYLCLTTFTFPCNLDRNMQWQCCYFNEFAQNKEKNIIQICREWWAWPWVEKAPFHPLEVVCSNGIMEPILTKVLPVTVSDLKPDADPVIWRLAPRREMYNGSCAGRLFALLFMKHLLSAKTHSKALWGGHYRTYSVLTIIIPIIHKGKLRF